MSFLVYHVPSGFYGGTKLVHPYATYAALGLIYSLVNIPRLAGFLTNGPA